MKTVKTLGRYIPLKLLQRLDQILTWSSLNEPAPSLSSGLEKLTAVKKYLLFVLANTWWGSWPLFHTILTKGFTIANSSSGSLKCISVSYSSGVSESLGSESHSFEMWWSCISEPVSQFLWENKNSYFRNCQQADPAQPFVKSALPRLYLNPTCPLSFF